MKVINIFGGPGVGKSTQAHLLTANLKIKGYNTCFVPEYAKELVYKKRLDILKSNQYHVFETQSDYLDMRFGNVDISVCECPILLNIAYNKIYKSVPESFNKEVLEKHKKYNNLNYVLQRETVYKEEGRYQNEENAKEVDNIVLNVLDEYKIPYKTVGLNNFIELVLNDLKNES